MLHLITTAFIVAGGLVGIALGLYGLAPTFFQGRLERIRRLRLAAESRWAGDGVHGFEDEADEDDDYLAAIDALQRESGRFGLPSAWQQAAPAAGSWLDAADHERADAAYHERAEVSRAPFLEEVEAEAPRPGLADGEAEQYDFEPVEPALSPAMKARRELDAVLRGPDPAHTFGAGSRLPRDQHDAAEAEADPEVLEIFREVLPADRTARGRARAAATQGMDLRDVGIRDLLAEVRWTLRTMTPRPREAPQR